MIEVEGALICETLLLKSIDREDVDILNHLSKEPDSYTTSTRHGTQESKAILPLLSLAIDVGLKPDAHQS